MIAVQKKPKLKNAVTIAHTAKIVARILRRRIEREIEGVLGEDEFEFRRGKGTRDAIRMLRIISEGTCDIGGELCACFIDWQKAFGHIKWTKLMQILKEAGMYWHERRLISKLYVDKGVGLKLYKGETKCV
jgi:hypothetical protein